LDPRSLLEFARIKPLAAWSLSGGLLGTALAFQLAGGQPLYIAPMLLAILCVVLMQYVAHPMNDIMDLELDGQAAITATGRVKPIVDGAVTVREAKLLTVVIVSVIILLIAVLVAIQPVLIFPAAYGMVALIGYNHPSLRWAYKPFTELYLSMPINAISVAVIAFIGSGLINGAAIVISLAFGFASSAFFVSMMSMDYRSDRANGKRTTVVMFPHLRWCTYYPLIGLAVALIGTPVVLGGMGPSLALAFILLSTTTFIILAWFGKKADDLRLTDKGAIDDGQEYLSGRYRLRQLYLSVIYATLLTVILLSLGRT
jgi:1,4-dihydroxy-2-naphthoate octaprenyltransferase